MGLVVTVAGFFQKAYCYRYPNLLSSVENSESTLRDSEGTTGMDGYQHFESGLTDEAGSEALGGRFPSQAGLHRLGLISLCAIFRCSR